MPERKSKDVLRKRDSASEGREMRTAGRVFPKREESS